MNRISNNHFKELHCRSKAVNDLATSEQVIISKEFPTIIDDVGSRTLDFVISTAAVDRDGDSVDQDGWNLDNYKKNPVVLFAHDSDQLPIGKCISIGVEDGKLKATVQFVPSDVPVIGDFAEAVYRLCKDGFLNATSVGFRPIDWEWADDRPDGIDFKSAELCEFSIVPVPANPQALIEERDYQPESINITRSQMRSRLRRLSYRI